MLFLVGAKVLLNANPFRETKSQKGIPTIMGCTFTKSNFGIFNIDIDYEQPVFLLQIHYILSLPVGQAVAKYQVQLRDRVR